MHSCIIHNKLASLYVCFAMLHTTLHNETDIIHRRYQNQSIEHRPSIRQTFEENGFYFEENNVPIQLDAEESEIKIFDMIIPKFNEDILLWPKAENYVTIPYALDQSLSGAQRRTIPAVLRSIEDHTCIRFMADLSPCGGGGTKLCFRAGRERAAHLGRRPGGAQPVTLSAGDGRYWVLHLVGHVLGLPHPHTCLHGPPAGQEHRRNTTRTGCVSPRCRWRRFDPGSALQLTAEELVGGWRLPHLNSAPALLALWRTRRAARLSHWDRLALHDMYRCDEHRPRCPPRRCRHGGFTSTHCKCVCPPGFGGDDCRVRTGSGSGDRGCVRHLAVGTELEVTPSELSELGTTAAGDQCVLRVRTSSQRLRVTVRLDGAEGELSKISPNPSVMLHSEALLCTIRMYAFQNGSFSRTFCILDYLGETLLLNVASNVVDLMFSLDPSLVDKRQILERTRLVVRSADDSFKNLTGNATTAATSANTTTATMAATTAAPVEQGQMRSAVGTALSTDLIILPPILFALMGFNFLVVFCIKKYWEYRYGTAGIYRGNEGGDSADQDEEEPEDWQIKVEYSTDSLDGTSPMAREMARESSFAPAEMTDLERFGSMYGVPGYAPPDTTEEERLTAPTKAEAIPSDEGQNSAANLTLKVVTPSKIKKQVSFSDDIGKPLHVHSDAPLEEGKGTPASKGPGTPASRRPTEPQPEAAAEEEERVIVPFTEDIQHVPSADSGDDSDGDEGSEHGDDSDGDEGSEQSSCCDTSSSSSYHEDEDDPKKAEPGLLHGLTRCFRRKPDNESSEI